MKISILGSCITRDIFREMKLDHLVKSYRARTSIHSITQEKKADYSFLSLPDSNFQKRIGFRHPFRAPLASALG